MTGAVAARQLHVALGVVRDADAPHLQHLDVGLGYPDAVCRQHTGPEEAEALQVGDRRRSTTLLRRLRFVLRFRQVDQRRHAVAPRQIARRLQRRPVQRVDRMRRDRRRDQRVVLERDDERFGAGEPSAGVFASATGNWITV